MAVRWNEHRRAAGFGAFYRESRPRRNRSCSWFISISLKKVCVDASESEPSLVSVAAVLVDARHDLERLELGSPRVRPGTWPIGSPAQTFVIRWAPRGAAWIPDIGPFAVAVHVITRVHVRVTAVGR